METQKAAIKWQTPEFFVQRALISHRLNFLWEGDMMMLAARIKLDLNSSVYETEGLA